LNYALGIIETFYSLSPPDERFQIYTESDHHLKFYFI